MSDVTGGAATVAAFIGTLRELPQGVDDRQRIDLIRALEDLKAAAAAVQTGHRYRSRSPDPTRRAPRQHAPVGPTMCR